MKVSIIGTGAYSLALAINLIKNNHKVAMWTENPYLIKEYQETKALKKILNIKLPDGINLTTSLEEVLTNTKLIILATSSKYTDIICQKLKPFYKKNIPICIATKGIEDSTQELLSEVVKRTLLTDNIAIISGPTFALDLASLEPVALALASTNYKSKKLILKTLANDNLKLVPTKDIIGTQLCGALKNVIAIASGIINGLGFSESTQCFLINSSLLDLKDIIYYLGGSPKTILSFAGIGDLTLTCMSKKSRNYTFGYIIGKTNNNQKEVKAYLNNTTVEGYDTLDTIYQLLKRKNINNLLITTIYNIVYNEDNPKNLIEYLINQKR